MEGDRCVTDGGFKVRVMHFSKVGFKKFKLCTVYIEI